MIINFFVPGIPQPGGSKRGFYIPKIKRVVITDANEKKVKPWRQSVVAACREVYAGELLTGPLTLSITFQMPRPKGHYGSGKNAAVLRASAPKHPTSKPDRTKLLRALEDALNGVLWKDDTQIVGGEIQKCYHDRPGALVEVREL